MAIALGNPRGMPRSSAVWRLGFALVWFFFCPPSRDQFTLKASLGRAAWRTAMPVLIVPLGLALTALIERYPDHPITRAVLRVSR